MRSRTASKRRSHGRTALTLAVVITSLSGLWGAVASPSWWGHPAGSAVMPSYQPLPDESVGLTGASYPHPQSIPLGSPPAIVAETSPNATASKPEAGHVLTPLGGSGNEPVDSAYDSSNGYIYVADFASGAVSVIAGASNSLVATIPVGTNPLWLAYDLTNGLIYVPNTNSGDISVINGSTDSVAGTVSGSGEPHSVVYDPSNGLVYSPNWGGGLEVVNGLAEVKDVIVGTNPLNGVYDASNGLIYVSNSGSNNVTAVNTTTDKVVANIHVGSSPNFMAYDVANGCVYVANSGSNNVSIINGTTNAVSGSPKVGSSPGGVVYDSANEQVYVFNSGSNNVSALNGTSSASVVAKIPVGSGPGSGAFNPADQRVYVSDGSGTNVTVINGSSNKPFASISVGSTPGRPTFDAGDGELYVANLGSNNVSSILTGSTYVVSAPSIGDGDDVEAYDSHSGLLYLESPSIDSVTLVNGTTHAYVTSLTSSGLYGLGSVAWDAWNGCVYLLDYSGNQYYVTPMCGATFEKSIAVNQPSSLIFDPTNGYLYVGTSAGISVINGATNSVVKTVGLPNGALSVTPDEALDAVDALLYAVNGNGGLSVIETSTNAAVANLSSVGNAGYTGVSYNAKTAEVYATELAGPAVGIYKAPTHVLVTSLTPSYGQPAAGTPDLTSGFEYIDCKGGAIMVLNTTNSATYVTNHISSPASSTFDPANGYVYIANGRGGNVIVLNGTSVANVITVGPGVTYGSYDPGASTVDVLITYPGGSQGPNGWISAIGVEGPVPDWPDLSYPTVNVTNGFQEATVNWTDSSERSSSFAWGPGRAYGLRVPELSGTSVNLNALASSTLYNYRITDVETGGAVYWTTGTFRTWDVPPNSATGWVYKLVSSPYLLNQVGAPISGATIGPIWATCMSPAPALKTVRVAFPYGGSGGGHPLAAASTNSTGAYSIDFPLTYVLLGGTTYNLYENGTCQDNVQYGENVGGWQETHQNPHLSINVSARAGYWNATQYVSMDPSQTTGFQLSYGLLPNGYTVAPVGVAFSHTPYAGCTVGITNGAAQSLQNYVDIFGYQQGTTAYGWVNSTTTASARYNGTSSITYNYNTTGMVNESGGNVSVGEAQAYGPAFNLSSDVGHFVDPLSGPPPLGNNSTSQSFVTTIGPNSTQWKNYSNGGTYTSTGGLNAQVGVSFGWGGVSVSTGIALVDLNSQTTDSSHATDCVLKDPNSTYAYQFEITLDGTQATQADAINVHIWFVGKFKD
jgi:YVTN family beta-propeller protein